VPVAISPARVLVVGSANVDFTVAAPRLPAPGETVSEGTLLITHGGKGANQAVAARRLGADVRLIASVGADDAGQRIVTALAAEGIGVGGVSVADRPTGTALIVVDPAGRNQIAVAPGANRALTVEQVTRREDDFAWAQIVVCQLEIPLAVAAWSLAEARRRGAITILNPAPVPAEPLSVWPLVDYLTPNLGEATRLSGTAEDGRDAATTAATRLRARGAGHVLVTLGAEGVLAVIGDGAPLRVGGRAVEVVDTTAAGDAFNGALAVALGQRRGLEEALRFANAAGALACTRRGAQVSLPALAEVERLLEN
jgi:ribokinase